MLPTTRKCSRCSLPGEAKVMARTPGAPTAASALRAPPKSKPVKNFLLRSPGHRPEPRKPSPAGLASRPTASCCPPAAPRWLDWGSWLGRQGAPSQYEVKGWLGRAPRENDSASDLAYGCYISKPMKRGIEEGNPEETEALLKKRRLLLASVKNDGMKLIFASPRLRNDPDVVLTAVEHSGEALKHASERLQNDRQIVMAAVKQTGSAHMFASRRLQKDPQVVHRKILSDSRDDLVKNPYALRNAPKVFRHDRDIVLLCASRDGRVLEFTSQALRDDRDVVLAAVKQNGEALKHASERLRNDREVVLVAVDQEGYAIIYASHALQSDDEVRRRAEKQNHRAFLSL